MVFDSPGCVPFFIRAAPGLGAGLTSDYGAAHREPPRTLFRALTLPSRARSAGRAERAAVDCRSVGLQSLANRGLTGPGSNASRMPPAKVRSAPKASKAEPMR